MPHQTKGQKTMKKPTYDKPANPDRTRDKWGVKATRRKARRNKDKRRDYESSGKGWK